MLLPFRLHTHGKRFTLGMTSRPTAHTGSRLARPLDNLERDEIDEDFILHLVA